MDTLKKLWVFCLLAVLALGCKGPEIVAAQSDPRISMQTFYDELSPYGRWVPDPLYGYVWVPDVEPGFRPYATRGNWVMTQYGNMWVSDYTWGWAPFHYGRWNYDSFYGWVWVPGLEWGPSWVAWRSGGGYYGWAPLGPGMNVNVNINLPLAHWVFVPQRHFMSPRLYRYYQPGPRVMNVYNQTTIINNYYTQDNRTYVYGPRAQDIERNTRQRVQVYEVNNQGRPSRTEVQNGVVRVYRPEVNAGRADAAPSRVSPGDNRPRTDRSADTNAGRPRLDRGTSGGTSTDSPARTRVDRSTDNQAVERREPAYREGGRPSRTTTPDRPERAERLSDRDGDQPVYRRPDTRQRQAESIDRSQPAQPERMERPRYERPTERYERPAQRPEMTPEIRRPERTREPQQPQRTEQYQQRRVEPSRQIEQPRRVEQPQRVDRSQRVEQPQYRERPQRPQVEPQGGTPQPQGGRPRR